MLVCTFGNALISQTSPIEPSIVRPVAAPPHGKQKHVIPQASLLGCYLLQSRSSLPACQELQMCNTAFRNDPQLLNRMYSGAGVGGWEEEGQLPFIGAIISTCDEAISVCVGGVPH